MKTMRTMRWKLAEAERRAQQAEADLRQARTVISRVQLVLDVSHVPDSPDSAL